jgi:hypothetical protein
MRIAHGENVACVVYDNALVCSNDDGHARGSAEAFCGKGSDRRVKYGMSVGEQSLN